MSRLVVVLFALAAVIALALTLTAHPAPRVQHCQREWGRSAGQTVSHWQTFCRPGGAP